MQFIEREKTTRIACSTSIGGQENSVNKDRCRLWRVGRVVIGDDRCGLMWVHCLTNGTSEKKVVN